MGNGCFSQLAKPQSDTRVAPMKATEHATKPLKIDTQTFSIQKNLGVNAWIKDRLESVTTQKSPQTLRNNFRKLKKRRSTFITVEGVQYKVCMQRVKRPESEHSDRVLSTVFYSLLISH